METNYQRHREERKRKALEYYYSHKAEFAERHHEYYIKNKDELRVYMKNYQREHREAITKKKLSRMR